MGELHVDSFPVTFTKDGFAWEGGLEDALGRELAQQCDAMRAMAKRLRKGPDQSSPPSSVGVGGSTPPVGVPALVGGAPIPRPRAQAEPELGLERTPVAAAVGSGPSPRSHLVVASPLGDFRATVSVEQATSTDPWLSLVHHERGAEARLNEACAWVSSHSSTPEARRLVEQLALATAVAEAQARAVFGETVPVEELRAFLDAALKHVALG